MNAIELSKRIQDDLERGAWAAAHQELLTAWRDAVPFGFCPCEVLEYSECFVTFKTSGYPFALRNKWSEVRDDKEALEIVLRYVESWKLKDVNGNDVPLPPEVKDAARGASILDNVEDALVAWLIRRFSRFFLRELSHERKNFSPPLLVTSSATA